MDHKLSIMGTLEKILESNMKVRFHDCDPFSHLNNSRYIDYMITARADQLIDHYNLDIYQLAHTKGLGWVTAETQISYLQPANLMEEVVIQTRLNSFTEKSLLFEAIMWNRDKNVAKCIMWTKLVHYDIRNRSVHIHDESLMNLFRQVVHPLPLSPGFGERVKQVRAIHSTMFNENETV